MKLIIPVLLGVAHAGADVTVRLGLLAAFGENFCPGSTHTPLSTATGANQATNANCAGPTATGFQAASNCPVGTGKCISTDRRAKGKEIKAAFQLACDFFSKGNPSGTPAGTGAAAAGKPDFFSKYTSTGALDTSVLLKCDNDVALNSGHSAYDTAQAGSTAAVDRKTATRNFNDNALSAGGFNVNSDYLLLLQNAKKIAAKTTGTGGQVVAVIGASRSSATIPVAQYYGQLSDALPQISYGSTSAKLNNKCDQITPATTTPATACPKFLRVVSPDTYQATAMVALLTKWGVKKVGVISATGEAYTVGLEAAFKAAWTSDTSRTIVGEGKFVHGTGKTKVDGKTNAYTAVKKLKDTANGSAVNMIFTQSGDFVSVLKAAKDLGILGAGWTWIGGDSTTGVQFVGSTAQAATAAGLNKADVKGIWGFGLTMASSSTTVTSPGKPSLTATWKQFTDYWKAKCAAGATGDSCRKQYQGLVNAADCGADCSRVRAYVAHVVDAVIIAGNAAWRVLAKDVGTGAGATQARVTRANMFTALESFKAPSSAANGAPGAANANALTTKVIQGFTTGGAKALGFTKKGNGIPAYSLMQVQGSGLWKCAGTWAMPSTLKLGATGADAATGDCATAVLGTAKEARPTTPQSSPASLYTIATALTAVMANLL